MSEVKLRNPNSQTIIQNVKPVQTSGGVVCACPQTIPAINNTNNYYPTTYQQPYYVANYGYQTPYQYMQYPAAKVTVQPAVQQISQQNQTQPTAVQTAVNPQQTQQIPVAKTITNPQQGQQPVVQTITNPSQGQIAQGQITPGATIDAAGTKCEIPPGTSGLNIIINSPTVATPGSHPMINTNTNCYGDKSGSGTGVNTTPNSKTKTKKVVALTDDYIKNLENYLRNPNKDLKMFGAQELSRRFEEDETRKSNPSLNALLNLVLQAKEPQIRFVGLAALKSGIAGGNDLTVQILNNLQQSKTYQGHEANDAKEALLKMSETVVKVPDNTSSKPKSDKNGGDD